GREALGGGMVGAVFVVVENGLQHALSLGGQRNMTDTTVLLGSGPANQPKTFKVVHQFGDRALGQPQPHLQL
ncbi:hypothetical protein SB786_37740, partial [Burkholderia sp. SIMBA_062]